MGDLKEIAFVFFKLGCIAFGGPAAHIAMMEEEVVQKRKWISRQHFLDLMGATHLIPGPNSTELTMHCGYQRGGILGVFVAGISFIFPAVIITGVFAWLYVSYGKLPEIIPFIYGIKPAVLVIIAMAILKLGKKAVKGYELTLLGILVILAALLGCNEVVVLLVAGGIGTIYFHLKKQQFTQKNHLIVLPLFLLKVSSIPKIILSSSIFWSFLKVGAILYGSGYVLFAYLDAELVASGLLSRQELIDAIAIGQLTPGPVLSTATFIGYQLNGISGAIAATIGIFLPSFIFVLILNPLVDKMRASKILSYFLDSVNVAAVAIMLVVLVKMGYSSLISYREFIILGISILLIYKIKKMNSIWLVPIGAIIGYLLTFI
ncbi:chromate efflux transporter [Tenacibaculum maritimum]|uniref:chromate efflux transporter n=1 Tax=Tenacibaculum maritimum TaxID=107401 RepID=UPI0012E60E43|nr:chromate efflux transporter [Tenacibaculum maritimum]MCD9561654.1 chromate efflux transporter [Tenacibaculum maritimum]MCD9566640.1 chromate efflux transporter [Tenacibaculum maritimum]MCD9577790.1 chromate efflux transporter [Tenacibaculum maritimum]MCD9597354.1 chromate efflux transporter [Tenacibaculum maritimum]MCD9612312.1 chromate efflux transporter [Tenacibaculum maritimum]